MRHPDLKELTLDIDKPFLFFVRDIELDVELFLQAYMYADPDHRELKF